MLYKIRYILWVAAPLGACDVIQDGRHIGRHLGFYRKLEIAKRRKKLEVFDAGHLEYDIIKHFAAFCLHFCIFHIKRVKKQEFFFKKWLDHLLLMTSYLVTIATDSHQTCVKMCLRDIRTADENGRSRE